MVFAACAACLACWLMSRAFCLPPFANIASGGPSALCKALGVGRKGPPGGRRELHTFREEERATLTAGAFAASVAVLCGVGTHMAHSLTSHSCAVIARAPWLLNSCCAGSARWGVRFRRRRKTRKPNRMIASNADSQSRAGAWYLPTLCTATHARRNTHTHAQKEREGGRERDGEGRREEGEREGGRGGERGRVREKDRET